ncbi:hypothetical protein GOOTI_006_00050 [Gordonia otitidis NBRC 100426]|uniref:Uncharacterized protein n=1 Tax=Gordonia otitidis (strain DSM 44809 / CCUG 52243 / JCM 12355 / NBRC 100426 / IFM 10032) TaxID=1108044 RepID=H5TG29_GORO1|nr:hypothetical protein GOOTI_006_00050 [Gordonia otitidis NBRC 100426]
MVRGGGQDHSETAVRSRSGVTWLVRVIAATTLCSVFAAGATGNGTAAVVATQAAHQQQVATSVAQKKAKPTPKPAETYDERLNRIAESKRSLLATPRRTWVRKPPASAQNSRRCQSSTTPCSSPSCRRFRRS